MLSYAQFLNRLKRSPLLIVLACVALPMAIFGMDVKRSAVASSPQTYRQAIEKMQKWADEQTSLTVLNKKLENNTAMLSRYTLQTDPRRLTLIAVMDVIKRRIAQLTPVRQELKTVSAMAVAPSSSSIPQVSSSAPSLSSEVKDAFSPESLRNEINSIQTLEGLVGAYCRLKEQEVALRSGGMLSQQREADLKQAFTVLDQRRAVLSAAATVMASTVHTSSSMHSATASSSFSSSASSSALTQSTGSSMDMQAQCFLVKWNADDFWQWLIGECGKHKSFSDLLVHMRAIERSVNTVFPQHDIWFANIDVFCDLLDAIGFTDFCNNHGMDGDVQNCNLWNKLCERFADTTTVHSRSMDAQEEVKVSRQKDSSEGVSGRTETPSLCGNPACVKRATMRCAGCGEIYYCSKQCQKSDWAAHKNYCLCVQSSKHNTQLAAALEIARTMAESSNNSVVLRMPSQGLASMMPIIIQGRQQVELASARLSSVGAITCGAVATIQQDEKKSAAEAAEKLAREQKEQADRAERERLAKEAEEAAAKKQAAALVEAQKKAAVEALNRQSEEAAQKVLAEEARKRKAELKKIAKNQRRAAKKKAEEEQASKAAEELKQREAAEAQVAERKKADAEKAEAAKKQAAEEQVRIAAEEVARKNAQLEREFNTTFEKKIAGARASAEKKCDGEYIKKLAQLVVDGNTVAEAIFKGSLFAVLDKGNWGAVEQALDILHRAVVPDALASKIKNLLCVVVGMLWQRSSDFRHVATLHAYAYCLDHGIGTSYNPLQALVMRQQGLLREGLLFSQNARI